MKLKVTENCLQCGSATITKAIHVYAYYLTVTSAYDTPTGQGWYDSGALVSSSVTPVVQNHVCTGWTGTGSAPATGTATSVSFIITKDSTVMSNWITVPILGPSVGGEWSPITMQALTPLNALSLAPWIILTFMAAASAFFAYRRIFRKRF